MKFSCCVGLNAEKLKTLNKVGCKYFEPSVEAVFSASQEDYESFLSLKNEFGMEAVAANGMFPGRIGLLRGKECYSEVSEYLDNAFARCQKLGIPVGILGSGKAREIPEGMSKEEAFERFSALLSDVVSPYAKKYGIIIGIEELRSEECSFINSCREAMELIRAVNLPNIKLLVDYYHAMLGGDTLEELESYGDNIVHVHIASPKNNRNVPAYDDLEDCRTFFAMLQRINYKGGISLEGRFGDDFEASLKTALEVMTKAL